MMVGELMDYFTKRIEKELVRINNVRKASNLEPLKPTETTLEYIAYNLTNYIEESEEFQEEVTSHIIALAERDGSVD